MAKQKRKRRNGWKVVFRYLLKYKKEITVLSILGLISALANGAVPYLVGQFIDSILDSQRSISVFGFVVAFWLFMLFLWLFVQLMAVMSDWALRTKQAYFETQINYSYLSDGLAHMYRLPMSYHKEKKSGSVMDNIGWSAMWLRRVVGEIIIQLAPQFLSVFIGVLFALYINPIAAIPLIVGVILYTLLLLKINKPAAQLQRKAVNARVKAWGFSSDALKNVQSVKQFTAENFISKRVRRLFLKKLGGIEVAREKKWNTINFTQRLIVIATQLTIFIISVLFIIKGEMTIGELVALNGYAAMFFGPFIVLGHNWTTIQNGIVAIEKAEKNILGRSTERYSPSKVAELGQLRGGVEFKNASFSYNSGEEKLLENINIKINAGEIVALVGESGVGKSTLVDLIGAYYFPTKGKVLIGGHNIKKLNLEFLRKNIAVVPQEVLLFNDTILNNLKFAKPDATKEQIIEAAKEAKAHEFIKKFPKGYKSKVGERGVKLSVGQKQRIAIARAILRDPKILILDEPTSALDAKTEHKLTQSLEKLMEGRTTIIIAHRLSTVRRADKIIVLKGGKVVETGPHDELIKIKDGVYRELYELQKID